MTIDEAASELRKMYFSAAHGDKSIAVVLFGLKYADDLGRGRLSIQRIISRARIPPNYSPMVNKGRKLANYVVLKEDAK